MPGLGMMKAAAVGNQPEQNMSNMNSECQRTSTFLSFLFSPHPVSLHRLHSHDHQRRPQILHPQRWMRMHSFDSLTDVHPRSCPRIRWSKLMLIRRMVQVYLDWRTSLQVHKIMGLRKTSQSFLGDKASMQVVWLISNRPLSYGYGRIPIEDQKCWKTVVVLVGSDLELESES